MSCPRYTSITKWKRKTSKWIYTVSRTCHSDQESLYLNFCTVFLCAVDLAEINWWHSASYAPQVWGAYCCVAEYRAFFIGCVATVSFTRTPSQTPSESTAMTSHSGHQTHPMDEMGWVTQIFSISLRLIESGDLIWSVLELDWRWQLNAVRHRRVSPRASECFFREVVKRKFTVSPQICY